MGFASLVSHSGFEYRLGRHQVPVDVCGSLVKRSPSSAVPRAIRSDADPTRPIEVQTQPRGPTPADIDRLAAGELDEVELSGRYRLGALLGQGGMARVFRAEQRVLGRQVAIKILDDRRSDSHDALRRFLTEARITAGLRHPNIVEVTDFGSTPEGVIYLVMELLEGEDLGRTLDREGPLSWARTRGLLLQLCAGLAVAHERGVVHRDLKPSNCFCVSVPSNAELGAEPSERVKLLDFGIAISCAQTGPDQDDPDHDQDVVGTPEYMSPEQARGESVDARSDVYSLGVILAELLTGRVPFTGRSAASVLGAHIDERPPSLRALSGRAEVDEAIEAVYTKALSKNPAARFASVRELANAIAAIPAERKLARRPRTARALLQRAFAATFA